jgi:hypothetical protein
MGKIILCAVALFSVSGCDWVGFLVKESALSLTGRSGWDSFTIEGKLPADFEIEAQASYVPLKADNCQFYSVGLGHETTRTHAKSFKALYKTTPQDYRFKVPLTYSIGLCEMALNDVHFLIGGRYGDLDWQRYRGRGGLRIVQTLPEGAPGFKADGTLDIQGECTWLFQESTARSRLGQISKLLKCKGAGAYVQSDQLPGKTIRLAIGLNPEERPYYDNSWIKFPEGWKPCAEEKGGWIWCRNPPTFKTFKMNDQTCTVYPNCTE